MYQRLCYLGLFIIFTSCTYQVKIKNEKKGKLSAKYQLVLGNEKKIWLDYETASQPPYMQLIQEANGARTLSIRNPHNNGINFYDYETGDCTHKIVYAREGPDAILRLEGYYVKNMDSIYVYVPPYPGPELALTDSSGHVKERISLIDNRDAKNPEWSRYYPQYFFNTVVPIIENRGKLFLTGLAPTSVVDSLIHKFYFTSCFDLKSKHVEFKHTYPEELYGSNANWNHYFFTQVYPALLPTGEWLYSFPVSHNVYLAKNDEEGYKKIYAGSNEAGTICSYDFEGPGTYESVLAHLLQHDLYTAIIHDPFREVFYRFMLKRFPSGTTLNERPVVIIIMDEQFNYMGETVIGTCEEWNWENAFVTSEGLVIEYIDRDLDSEEEYLILKTLTIEKL